MPTDFSHSIFPFVTPRNTFAARWPLSGDTDIVSPENSFVTARHCLCKKLIEGKVFAQWQELLLERLCSLLFLRKFMHGDQSLRTMVCFVHLVLLVPQLSLKWLYPQCVLRLPDCTVTNSCILCLVSVFKEKPLHPPSRAQALIQSRTTEEYSYMQSILRLLRNASFLLLMVTYGKVWPFFCAVVTARRA